MAELGLTVLEAGLLAGAAGSDSPKAGIDVPCGALAVSPAVSPAISPAISLAVAFDTGGLLAESTAESPLANHQIPAPASKMAATAPPTAVLGSGNGISSEVGILISVPDSVADNGPPTLAGVLSVGVLWAVLPGAELPTETAMAERPGATNVPPLSFADSANATSSASENSAAL